MKNLKKRLRDLFVPHRENGHSPHFWRDKSVGVILAIVLLAELAVFAQSFVVLRKDSYLASVLPAVLTSLTNGQRLAYELHPVTENQLLVEAAQMKANDMAKREYFAHNTPDGKLPWYWLDQVGYKYSEAGENLAVNFFDSKDVVDAWMKSPTHKANIVKGTYTEIGIAMADGIYQGHPAVYVVQFFGKPKNVPAGSPATSPSASTFAKAGADALGFASSSASSSTASSSAALPAVSSSSATTSVVASVAGAKTQTRPSAAKTTGAPSASAAKDTTTHVVATTTPAASLAPASGATSSATSSLDASSTSEVATVATTSSSTAQVLPQVAGAEIDRDTQASAFQAFASSPRHVAMYVLVTLLIIILAAYLIMIFVTRRVHHPRILLLTIAFILIIAGLLAFNSKFLKDRMEVGNGESTFMSTDMSADMGTSSPDVDAARAE